MFTNIMPQRASAAIVAVVWGVSGFIPGWAGRLTAQEGERVSISVDEGRPLKAVVMELEQRFGWIVTYEDPAYLFAPEIKDVRHLRNDGKDLPLLAPRGGPFTFSYTLPRATQTTPPPQEAMLGALLDQYHRTGYPGRFRLVRTGVVYHVVPTMARDEAGVFRPYGSILDRRISLPDREVDGMEMLELIKAAVRRGGDERLLVGTFLTGMLLHARVQSGARDESVRSVLLRMFASFNPRLSWKLLCGPAKGSDICALNIHEVRPVSR
jgi:hypothetical protein